MLASTAKFRAASANIGTGAMRSTARSWKKTIVETWNSQVIHILHSMRKRLELCIKALLLILIIKCIIDLHVVLYFSYQ